MNRVLDTSEFQALGTACAVRIACAPVELPLARLASIAARAEIVACERVLSRFEPTSDLSRVNSAPGRWTVVDPRLIEAVDAALRFERETDGRCSPFLLSELTAAGYDRSFERVGNVLPRTPERRACSAELQRPLSRMRASSEGAIDLGGTAKGLVAARALRAARRSWPGLTGALVDLGGDLAVAGTPPEGGPWLVDVEDPRSPGDMLGTVRLASGGVATSGPSRRRFGPSRLLHHLIDPVTGAPAADGPLAVTAVAADPVAADAHATALAITPVDEAADYVARRPGLGAVVALDVGAVLVLGSVDFVARKVLVA